MCRCARERTRRLTTCSAHVMKIYDLYEEFTSDDEYDEGDAEKDEFAEEVG